MDPNDLFNEEDFDGDDELPPEEDFCEDHQFDDEECENPF